MYSTPSSLYSISRQLRTGQFMGFSTRNLQRLGNTVTVTFPTDEQGFLGRECPHQACLGYFKVRPGTGLSGPDLQCHCPYCGHAAGGETFATPEQVEYAKSIALRQFTEAFRRDLKQLEFNHRPRPGTFGIGISLKVTPGAPIPIRHYRERGMETHVSCAKCTLDYAIFGLFAFCPDCGEHNSGQVLEKNLEIILKLVELAESQTDVDLKRQLIEDALENCISAFDGFARESCRVRASRSTDPEAAVKVSFQNLDRAAQRMRTLFGIDLTKCLAEEDLRFVRRSFLRRHLLAHRAGVVDEQYCRDAQDGSVVVGRRIVISATDVNALVAHVRVLGRALVECLPDP